MRSPVSAELVTQILRGDALIFELLFDRTVTTAALAKCSGILQFDRLLALLADVRALREAEQIFRLEFVERVGSRRRGCRRCRGHAGEIGRTRQHAEDDAG